jgi:hypothetical protein
LSESNASSDSSLHKTLRTVRRRPSCALSDALVVPAANAGAFQSRKYGIYGTALVRVPRANCHHNDGVLSR